MKDNELKVKFKPRKIDLEPRDLSKLSHLADGQIVEDPLGRHKPGTTFVINHGDIGSIKFPKIMFPAVNPIEFYLFSALRNLESIRTLESEVAKDSGKINQLLLEEFQFCIFAVSAIEAFVNQTILVDFEYKDKKGTVSKAEIERHWTIEEKLKKVIPQAVNVSIAGDTKVWNTLTSLVLLRNDLTVYSVVSKRHFMRLHRPIWCQRCFKKSLPLMRLKHNYVNDTLTKLPAKPIGIFPDKDKYGNRCGGRHGFYVNTKY